jgi:hypothetical protein
LTTAFVQRQEEDVPQESDPITRPESHRQGTTEEPRRRRSSGDDPGKFVIVANAALIGVPTAYATSQSVLVTVLAAMVAIVFVLVHAGRRPR